MHRRPTVPPQIHSCFPALPVPLGLSASTSPLHECAYLPGRMAVTRGFRCNEMPAWLYQELLDAGFRRSGTIFYQVACPGCRACAALRVPVDDFRPAKDQRRLLRRNRDLAVNFGEPELTEEKLELYSRYLAARHDGKMTGDVEELEEFLYRSPTDTLEVCYREPGGRLVGVGLCDLTPQALSSVYFFFDPELPRRGLGIFSMMMEIAAARSLGLACYYPGYWVAGCPRMDYKRRFRPSEILCADGSWRPFERTNGGEAG